MHAWNPMWLGPKFGTCSGRSRLNAFFLTSLCICIYVCIFVQKQALDLPPPEVGECGQKNWSAVDEAASKNRWLVDQVPGHAARGPIALLQGASETDLERDLCR